jgi:hypothetical protein
MIILNELIGNPGGLGLIHRIKDRDKKDRMENEKDV